MKIVADENIPLVKEFFGDVVKKPGRKIVRDDLVDADILLVRSVTKINEALLKNTRVKFVGSATIGFDHMDIDWLNQAGIQYGLAKGSNAKAVVEYVVCAVAYLQKNKMLAEKIRAAVIGVGDIGQRVADFFQFLGFDVVLCDPFRDDILSTPLNELENLDLISLHVPLTRQGEHPTFHLLDKAFLSRQKKNCVLLNTARGEVICFEDLKKYAQHLVWCFDVWENEPLIDFDVLDNCYIGTPHIAGYSIQGKIRGIEMIYRQMRQKKLISAGIVDVSYPRQKLALAGREMGWRDVVLSVFDLDKLTREMKHFLMEDENGFDLLRKKFDYRHEFGFVDLADVEIAEKDSAILRYLGFVI